MKSLVLFCVLLVGVSCYIEPGEIHVDKLDYSLARTSGGKQVKKGEFTDFCYLSVFFEEKYKNCGCVIYDKKHVITSARCVVDCAESVASNITVTFPFQSGKNEVLSVIRIFYPDEYEISKEAKFSFSIKNVALLRLEREIKVEDKTCGCSKGQFLPSTLTTVTETFTYIQTTFIDAKFMICGLGGSKKKIQCIDVIIIDPSSGNCINPDGSGDPFMPPDGYYCIQTVSGASLTAGDYGGPLYIYRTRPGPKGQVIITESITIIGLMISELYVEIIHQEWITSILKMKSELVCLK